ncbi:hypothetical protein [Anthocerotibacter panamensis]|uniref:hypothetical protein n=1 Tax=Anthocerotibacter panamensis TaxID=2857077 RepID=UPI001C401A18|nr:hypothetical protein [Anthocerotibacter panamensis]
MANLIEIIATIAADICWDIYREEQRIPPVRNTVIQLLEENGLKANEEAGKFIIYQTAQDFQNRLLRSRVP